MVISSQQRQEFHVGEHHLALTAPSPSLRYTYSFTWLCTQQEQTEAKLNHDTSKAALHTFRAPKGSETCMAEDVSELFRTDRIL